ncbi:deazaflavin-dependent nitroreductase [Nocardiopsis gilva YIM 90087]|uniref:Deazaflavin-dependent nitroreductase n=1 Tax=Nocardiopsis gilva YIM 90087 TaxID=1235441 RepID=A0A223S3E4_9ACTN|nr:nitroreductase/quinone reductase family protein [Nocardiopsis gilva]ASU82650.1 deazaflavin-dependent nitroreductase [Nocardiopsis gilva YIM 90087]
MAPLSRRSGPSSFGRALLPLIQRMAASALFARIAPRVLPRLDRFLARRTGGRVQIARWAVPSLMLTTTGQKSGEPRPTPVACLPERETGAFLVVGSNFGREKHPAWTGNLLTTPEAVVNYKGREIPVTGVLLSAEEKADVWGKLNAMWPYDSYATRAGREPRVFRLVPRRPPGR